ncbi:MAG: sugar transferase [Verrucomicrobia bacterium]|nr:sugar transferase [Verrucomicrobiota bacterium]
MLTQRSEGLRRLLLLCQILLVAGLFWFGVWVMVTFYSAGADLTWRRYSIYCVLLVLGLTLEFLGRDNSRDYLLQNELLRQHRLSLRQTFASVGALVIYLIATKDGFISRLFLFNFVPWLYVVLLFSHHYLTPFFARRIFNGIREEKTLLVGSPARARQLRNWLRLKSEIGLHTTGLISVDHSSVHDTKLPILGQPHDFQAVVREYGITQVILLEFPHDESSRAIIDASDQLGIRLIILSDLEETLRHPVVHFEDGGFRFIALREEPLENPMNRFLKRTIDIFASALVLIFVFPPLALIVWLAQRLQSPGPLLHKQIRAGIQNRRFLIYKFRTMHVHHHDVARQARDRDERVYPFARLLRKLSIDEVPQFWNVLRGEMSLVGPRPHLLEHNDQFAKLMASYHVRTFVKPGITGLAQVRGFRGEARKGSDIEGRVACDLEYLENWNLSLELGIIVRTVAQVFLPPPSAY